MKKIFFLLLILVPGITFSQLHAELRKIEPDQNFENVYVKKISEDSLQSSFIIWIKKDVKGHFHNEHTENIVVIEGRAEMLLDGRRIIIKEGDHLNIPKGTKHAVTKVFTRKPLKVLSIQSPYFDGKDRIFTTD